MTPSLYLGLRRARVVSSLALLPPLRRPGQASLVELPVDDLCRHLDERMGRPSKDLHVVIGVLLLHSREDAPSRERSDCSIRSGGAPPASPEDTLFEVVCAEVFRNWKPRTRKVRFDLYLIDTSRMIACGILRSLTATWYLPQADGSSCGICTAVIAVCPEHPAFYPRVETPPGDSSVS